MILFECGPEVPGSAIAELEGGNMVANRWYSGHGHLQEHRNQHANDKMMMFCCGVEAVSFKGLRLICASPSRALGGRA
jgi:hypothetical protein